MNLRKSSPSTQATIVPYSVEAAQSRVHPALLVNPWKSFPPIQATLVPCSFEAAQSRVHSASLVSPVVVSHHMHYHMNLSGPIFPQRKLYGPASGGGKTGCSASRLALGKYHPTTSIDQITKLSAL